MVEGRSRKWPKWIWLVAPVAILGTARGISPQLSTVVYRESEHPVQIHISELFTGN